MIDLEPCGSCRRHVAIDAAACPFCGAAQPARAPRPSLSGRWSRAAVFASAAALAACGSKKQQQPAAGSAVPAGSAAVADDATPAAAVAPDAAPAVDAAVVDAGEPDAAVDAGVIKMHRPVDKKRVEHHIMPKPYGAPPARRRVV